MSRASFPFSLSPASVSRFLLRLPSFLHQLHQHRRSLSLKGQLRVLRLQVHFRLDARRWAVAFETTRLVDRRWGRASPCSSLSRISAASRSFVYLCLFLFLSSGYSCSPSLTIGPRSKTRARSKLDQLSFAPYLLPRQSSSHDQALPTTLPLSPA